MWSDFARKQKTLCLPTTTYYAHHHHSKNEAPKGLPHKRQLAFKRNGSSEANDCCNRARCSCEAENAETADAMPPSNHTL